jgi:hypothetical protein
MVCSYSNLSGRISMKLNQVIALHKSVKNRVNDEVTLLHKALQKPELFIGHTKKYQPLDTEGERYEDEIKRVQFQVPEVLETIQEKLAELFDVESRKDAANATAKADVKVDGKTVLTGVPVTTLIFLEKQLTDFRSDLNNAPVLDPAEEWELDTNSGLHKTKPTKNHKTKKVQKPIVMYPHSEEHPAQTQLITEDVVVGHWETIKHSGALPKPVRDDLVDKANKLLDALKEAREEANEIEAPKVSYGQLIFEYLGS